MAADTQALVLQLSADIRGLEKQMARAVKTVDGSSKTMERRAQVANDNIGKKFGKGIGDSLGQQMDALAGRAGGASTALAAFGVAGVAAAAGIGAVVAAFAGARQAAAFADDIADTANRLHVTTDALQEYRYAIRAAGGDEKGADEALEAFSVTLGNAQRGLAKAQKAFLQLGFSKAQIASMTDADAALTEVAARINELPLTQQDALIKALGLDGLKPLLQGGVAEMQRLRDEAHKVGIVMDAELVRRGGELNDQFETVSKVIDVQMKSALVDLGPVLIDLLGLMADMAKAAANIADAFKDIEHKRDDSLRKRLGELSAQNASFGLTPDLGQRQQHAKNDAERARIEAELASRQARNAPPAVTPSRTLVDTSKTGKTAKGPRDSTAGRTAEVEGQLIDAERDLLQAWLGLIVGADQRAELQNELIGIEKDLRDNALAKKTADIQADDGLTQAKKDELTAKLVQVGLEQDKVDALKRESIERARVETNRAEALKLDQNAIALQAEVLSIQEGLATTAAERRDIELRLLDLADQREKAELEAVKASETASLADKEIAKKKIAALDATRGAREEGIRRGTQGPLEQFVFDNTNAEKSAEEFQRITVGAFDNLNRGVAELIANGGKAGDVLRGLVKQLLIDVTTKNLQQGEAALLSKFGIGQQTAGATLQTQIVTGGATAGQTIAAQMVAAGGAVAAQISAAMAAGGATGGANGIGSILSMFGSAAGAPGGAYNLGSSSGFFLKPGSLPMFAGGTDGAPGGLSLVGERGPEILNIPKGAQVIPNDILRGLSKGPAQGASQSFSPTLHVSVSGAGMSPADARRTGAQVGAAAMRQMAKARKAGF